MPTENRSEQTETSDPTGATGRAGFSRHSGLFSLLVDRPVLTLMITVAMLLVGVMALVRTPLTFMGEGMTWGTINVFVPVGRSRSPRETEDKVARPAEELLRTIPGIRNLRTNCSRTHVVFHLELDTNLDPVLAAAEVRDRIQRAMLEWPDGVDRYFTWREDGSSPPLHYFQILTPEFNGEWQQKVENIVTPRLEAVDGVGRVDIFGLHTESIRIWFDKDKLYAHRVDYRDLMRRLSQDNYTEPAGELDNEKERIILRVESKFRSLSDIEEFPVRPGLKIKDLATVKRDRREVDQHSRYDGRFTLTGSIRATSGANIIETSNRVRVTADELKKDPRLLGIDFRYLFDQGAFIENSLDNLLQASLKGGALALIVLFLFLRNLRATLAIGLAIPLTLLLVADFLYFTGDSLNILTMTGMTLAVGMVVDNSVVVLDNIRRLRHNGMPLRESCVEGAREVGLAVTMATLTTVVVFLPIIFMGTNARIRAMFASVGVPLSVALIGSLFIALMLLPSGVRRLGGMSEQSEVRLRIWSPIAALTTVTVRALGGGLQHRYKILLGICAYVAALCCGVLPSPLPSLDFASGDKNPFRSSDVQVRMILPKGLSEDDVFREVQRFEETVRNNKEKWRVKSVSTRYSRVSLRLDIELEDDVKPKDIWAYAKKIKAGVPRRPGFKLVVGNSGPGGEEEQDQRNFVVRIRGRDSDYLAALGLRLQEILEAREDVEMVEVSSVTDNEEVIVEVDRDRLQELGIGPEVLFGTMSGGLQGRELTRFEERGRDVRLVSQFGAATDPTLFDLKETRVFSNRGNLQRVGDVTTVGFKKTLDSIHRTNGKTTVTVLGRRTEGVGPREFSQTLQQLMSKFPMPRGYTWAEDSMSRQTAAQIRDLLEAGALSVVLVFMLMGVLFESIILPVAILVTIPIAVFGGMWALALFHGSIDPMAIIGLILLSGVVVNNGIVLLDCIERLRRGGMDRSAAIHEGIRIRLRPIVMTAATTIVGLLPLAIFGETTGQGVNYISLSITVVGGLALFHGSIDPMAIIGLILLSGVVVNNGIVLLDCIERLRRGGMDRSAAIHEGIRIRLRPIVMTAATTIVGLLPLAIFGETTGQGVNYISLSITVAGGLALCTVLTAPSVALAYTWLGDLSRWVSGYVRY